MREHYGLDRLIEYGTEPVPDAISVVNPEWRKLDGQIRSKIGHRHRQAALFGSLVLSEDPSGSELQEFQLSKAQMREEIEALDRQIDRIRSTNPMVDESGGCRIGYFASLAA
jgi:hypothetical protein